MVPTRSNKVKFANGERVLCYEPDPSMAKVLYESKILECIQEKGERGKRVTEYRIHFNGWNSGWDRCVPEEFILPDNEENRILQKKLFENATVKCKRNMYKRSNKEKLVNKKCKSLKESGDQSSKTLQSNQNDSKNDCSSSSQSTRLSSDESSGDESKGLEVVLEIPVPLKNVLTFDCQQIKLKNKLLKIPCQPNVITVLESFVKNVAVNILCSSDKPKSFSNSVENYDTKIRLCKEVVDGLRIYFDFMLPELLLYNQEQSQHSSIMSAVKRRVATSPIKSTKKETGARFDSNHDDGEHKSELTSRGNKRKMGASLQKDGAPKLSEKASRCSSRRFSEKQNDEVAHVYSLRNVHSNANQDLTKKTDCISTSTSSETKAKTKPRKSIVRQSSKLSEVSTTPTTATRLRFGRQISPQPISPLRSPENKKLSQNCQPKCSAASEMASTNKQSKENLANGQSLTAHHDVIIPNATLKKETLDGDAAIQEKLDTILAWKLLPDNVHEMHPVMPSYVYGALHLLRMFVKIPDLFRITDIKEEKMKVILQYIQDFLQYLTERKEDLFPKNAYVDA